MTIWKKAQETAIEMRDKLVLVSAAAGSGKTSVLTERVIRRILDPVSPLNLSDLLIVTFTRTAAAELKSKIASAIGKALESDPGNERLTEQLLQLGSASISTIDSFYLQIVRSNFEHLGLPADFRTADENELKVLSGEIIDELIPEFYKEYETTITASASQNPFETVYNNLFADALDHIFEGNSGSNPGENLLDFYVTFSRNKRGIELLNDAAESLCAEAELPFPQTRCGAFFLAHLEARTLSFYRVLQTVKAHHEADPESAGKQGIILLSDINYCNALLQAIRDKSWENVQKALNAFQFQDFKSAPGMPELSEQYHTARKAFKDLIETLVGKKKKESKTTEENQNAVFYFANRITPVEQKKVFLQTAELAKMLYRFYSEYQKRYNAEKIARGIQDFNDVRDAVLKMLNDPENEPFVASLREKYKEIYIDEYQDVDEIQDEIFARIGGNNRFMVGDIKQSIYGFRGSDPSIFAEYRKAMPLATSPEAESSHSVCVFMSDNFRCDQPIIDFTNAVCSFLFSASPDSVCYLPEDDLKYAKPVAAGNLEPAPVCVRIFEKPSNDKHTESQEGEESIKAEARWVAQEIGRLLREGKKDDGSNVEPGDIAILARASKTFQVFQKELEAVGIPIVSVAGNSISQSPVFIDLFNLLCIIDNPYRDIPLSEFLISDQGGFTLDEIHVIRKEFASGKSLYDAIVCAAASNAPVAEKAAAFVDWLAYYHRLATVQSADRLLRILYQDPKCKDFAFSPEFLTVYEQARVYQQTAWTGLYGFLNYLSRLQEADKLSTGEFRKAESAVNVMTIHASKGLEYPIVFVVGCGKAIHGKQNKEKMLYQKELGFASNLYNAETGLSKPSFLKTIVEFAVSDNSTEEEIRLLYVAMTRAREKLYLTGTPSRKLTTLQNESALIQINDRASILAGKSYLDWILAAQNNAKKAFEQVDLCCLPFIASNAPETEAPQEEKAPITEQTPMADPTVLYYRAVLERATDFTYPLQALQGIPTKAAASKLSDHLLDVLKGEDEAGAISERIRLMRDERPTFQGILAVHKQATAAQIGSATHQFLADCNYENLTVNGVKAELTRLVEQNFIAEETAKIVNLRALERFAGSPLLKKIRAAKQVYREQQFSLFIPLSELTENADLAAKLQGQELFVQGSIDLLLVGQDDTIELYDYKTDHITEEERKDPALLRRHMQERHGSQLECYARAVEQLFGKRPDRISIFSLSLGEIVDLDLV